MHRGAHSRLRLFLSTLSLRRATERYRPARTSTVTFLSTLSLRRATTEFFSIGQPIIFLSTLSLRRATLVLLILRSMTEHFYPRSPCGERRAYRGARQSRRHFYPRSPCGERRCSARSGFCRPRYFYPRSPCGERPHPISVTSGIVKISIHALLAESDIRTLRTVSVRKTFLSTLSLRRATCTIGNLIAPACYFYPRSPCGERLLDCGVTLPPHHFYPRSPCGERLLALRRCFNASLFLSTLSLRRATIASNAL